MRGKIFVVGLLITLLISCNTRNTQVNTTVPAKEDARMIVQSFELQDTLSQLSLQKAEGWAAFYPVNKKLKTFLRISPEEALSVAPELSVLTEKLRNSVFPELFSGNAMRARIHVLQNEVLRLEALSAQEETKAVEVNIQVTKILNILAAIHAKMNNIVAMDQIDRQVASKFLFKNPNQGFSK